MGLENVTKLAVALVMAAALTGQLPRLTNEIRHAQLKLLQDSKASKWGSPDLLRRIEPPKLRAFIEHHRNPVGGIVLFLFSNYGLNWHKLPCVGKHIGFQS